MITKSFHFNPLQVNCFVCYNEATKEALIIDPACLAQIEFDTLFSFIKKENLMVKHIVITHPHIDHVLGAKCVCTHYHLPLTLHPEGMQILKLAPKHAFTLGLKFDELPLEFIFVEENDKITFGDSIFRVVYTPGHCAGSICLINDVDRIVFTGDVLFNGSIGRTDLFTGDYNTLIDSILNKLFILEDDFVVRPGHGGRTSIGNEKTNNAYLIFRN
ncbi:MAG: MBL fold metallo-hydrolase [Bacteroidales bacterium]|nr:MBL fold metallo-hydrolase [Bacteroidales bacterium]